MTSRRDFLASGATAAAGLAIGAHRAPLAAQPSSSGAPYPPAGPVVVSSENGLRGVKIAYDQIVAGADTLDAIIAGVNTLELDPDYQFVGLGGLPNEEGVVQLDASCMHGPTNRAGAVACLEEIATPSLVAKAIMDYTSHIMLVGADAKRFAVRMGFKTQNLLTERSRQDWLRWRARLNPDDFWLDHDDDVRIKFATGTINMNAVNAAGDISSVTSTSGQSWKVAGRVGDSPIIGAGQYCDNTVGAAGATGEGEANIMACGGFLCVEHLRQGMSPEQAIMKTLERVVAMSPKRRLGDNGKPKFDLNYYVVAKDGRFAGGALYEGNSAFAVCDAKGPRVETGVYLFRRDERPRR